MTQQERDEIGKALSRAAVFYDRTDLDKTKISMMIDVIQDAFPDSSAQNILSAILNYRNNQKNSMFPSPAKLAQYLSPTISPDAQAQEIASRIIEAVPKFGYVKSGYQPAKEHIGNIGWVVVKRFGGWQPLCEDLGSKIPVTTFLAQAREIIKSQIEIQNTPNVDMSRLLNGPEKQTPQLSAPVKFSDEEAKEIDRVTKGQPRDQVENFIQNLAKTKSLKNEGAET